MFSRSSLRLAHSLQPSCIYLRVSASKPSFALRAMSSIKTSSHVGGSLINAVAEDHQEMYDYYDEYVKSVGDADAQERWSNQLRWEVARHAVGEELVVYPLMEKHLGAKGKALADNDRAEHHKIKELLYQLESLKPGTSEHAAVLKSVIESLKPHNDSEEQEDLPLLQDAIGTQGAATAAASFKRTKKFAPTRPHPDAPDKPPFETLVALLAAPLDKLEDVFAKFPTEEQKEALRG